MGLREASAVTESKETTAVMLREAFEGFLNLKESRTVLLAVTKQPLVTVKSGNLRVLITFYRVQTLLKSPLVVQIYLGRLEENGNFQLTWKDSADKHHCLSCEELFLDRGDHSG